MQKESPSSIQLTRSLTPDRTQPQFLSATVLPHKGMHLLQISAYLPATGVIELLASPDIEKAENLLNDPHNTSGDAAFSLGSAILLPYANRIRGTLQADGKMIETLIAGQKILLPANHSGTEKHAIHGLMAALPFSNIICQNKPQRSTLSGLLQAGNFNSHWLSQTEVSVEISLTDSALKMTVTAKNVGNELLPMGIGAHPYFAIPSGDRTQVRLHLPAKKYALVNNYEDVFPTGKLAPVENTPYDFTGTGGAALGNLYLDDSFTELQREDNMTTITIVDPIAHYGLKIQALSPEIKTIQVYAPPDKNFIAIEPQFNLSDPYNKIWEGVDTGMVMLKPGENISWCVRLELFVPEVNELMP